MFCVCVCTVVQSGTHGKASNRFTGTRPCWRMAEQFSASTAFTNMNNNTDGWGDDWGDWSETPGDPGQLKPNATMQPPAPNAPSTAYFQQPSCFFFLFWDMLVAGWFFSFFIIVCFRYLSWWIVNIGTGCGKAWSQKQVKFCTGPRHNNENALVPELNPNLLLWLDMIFSPKFSKYDNFAAQHPTLCW